jgi:hypothetical protein
MKMFVIDNIGPWRVKQQFLSVFVSIFMKKVEAVGTRTSLVLRCSFISKES